MKNLVKVYAAIFFLMYANPVNFSQLYGSDDLKNIENEQMLELLNIDNDDISVVNTITRSIPNLIQKSRTTTSAYPSAITFSPLGNFVAIISNGSFQTFSVSASGILSSTAISTRTIAASSISWSPVGNYIAVADNSANYAIRVYGVDATGHITSSEISHTNLGTSFYSGQVTWSPSGKYIAVNGINLSTSKHSIKIFGIDTKGHISSSVISSLVITPNAVIAWSPLSNFILMTDYSKIYIFGVSNTGHITSSARSSQYTAVESYTMAWSPNWSSTSGGVVAVLSYGSNTIQTFSVSTSGILSSTATSSQTTRTAPGAIAWSPKGNLIAVTSEEGNTIQTFNVDSSGRLSSATEAGYGNTVASPNSIAWSSKTGIIAITNSSSNTIQTF